MIDFILGDLTAFAIGVGVCFIVMVSLITIHEGRDFFADLGFKMFIAPLVVLFYTIFVFPFSRIERQRLWNDFYEWRIERIEKAATKAETKAADWKAAIERKEMLQQKMVDVCYKHPDIWFKKEGKK